MRFQCITTSMLEVLLSLINPGLSRWLPLWLLMGVFVCSSCMPTVTINDSQTPPPYELTLKVPPTPTPDQSKRYDMKVGAGEVFVQAKLESGWVVYAFATFVNHDFLITLKNPRYARLPLRIRFGESDPYTTLNVVKFETFQNNSYQLLQVAMNGGYFHLDTIQPQTFRCTTCYPLQPFETVLIRNAPGEEESYYMELELVELVNDIPSNDYISVKETPEARQRLVLGKALLREIFADVIGLYAYTEDGIMNFRKIDCMELNM